MADAEAEVAEGEELAPEMAPAPAPEPAPEPFSPHDVPISAAQIKEIWASPTSDAALDGHRGLAPADAFAPNAAGLYNMPGNVWEWTADWYQAAYPTGNPVIDPTGPASGSFRVNRGGSWHYDGTGLRSAERSNYTPSSLHNASRGFRVGFQQQ